MNAGGKPQAELPLWALPLAAGLLPLAGTVIAFQVAVAQGQFVSCIPFLEGCVSISRAARYDLPNVLFRAFLLPAATLQGLTWMLSARWLLAVGAPATRGQRLLPWIGVIAAIAAILYGTFLGTDGSGYRLMRRYGINFYFGFTCISMLIVAGALRSAEAARDERRRVSRALYTLIICLPLLGIVNATRTLYLDDEASQYAVGNVTEWWGGLIFTAYFVLVAALWHRDRFAARTAAQRG